MMRLAMSVKVASSFSWRRVLVAAFSAALGCVGPQSFPVATADASSPPLDGPSFPLDGAPRDAGSADGPAAPRMTAPADPCAGVRCEMDRGSRCQPTTGRCSPPTCPQGFGDCNDQPGCETRLDSPSHCGACNIVCGIGFDCTSDGCRCAAPFTVCGDQCVDVEVNARHCGRCFKACGRGCAAGVCTCIPLGLDNLVDNGGFDTATTSWKADDPMSLSWQAVDAMTDCALGAAGSMVIRDRRPDIDEVVVSQCTTRALDPATNFPGNVSLNVYLPSSGNAGGTVAVRVAWFSAAGCVPPSLVGMTLPATLYNPPPDRWLTLSDRLTVPPNARSAAFQIVLAKQSTVGTLEVWVDRAYLGAMSDL